MKLQLNVPDSLYETYSKQAESEVPSEVAAFMLARLDHFQGVDPRKGWLHLDVDSREKLEKITAGSIPTVEVLLHRVEALGGVNIANIRLEFTPAQLGEIKRRAEKNGESAEASVKRIVKMMEGLFFSGNL